MEHRAVSRKVRVGHQWRPICFFFVPGHRSLRYLAFLEECDTKETKENRKFFRVECRRLLSKTVQK